MSDVLNLSASELRDLLDQKKISSVELTKTSLDRIQKENPKYNAFISQTPEVALSMAKEADERIKRKEVSALTGIPIGIKDVIQYRGSNTTAASQFLKNYKSMYDATVCKKLRDAGAVFVGKTNCDEFAMGSSNENSSFGNVKNPWDVKRVPGGSSGGSAAAVSARLVPLALGTDTGGSIRQPASLCGLTGLKPTYGRVSRYGVVAFASSLDQVGPMTRTVQDTATLYQTIAGPDENDSTTVRKPLEDVLTSLSKGIKGLKIGYPKEYTPKELSGEVRDSFFDSLKKLEKLGAKVEEVSLPHTEYAIACYYIVATAEASSNLARYDGVRYTTRNSSANTLTELYLKSRTEGFGPEVKRRILLGTFVLSSGYYDAYYKKAQQTRTLIRNDFLKCFEKVDVIATPVSPTTAFPIGSKSDNPIEMYLSDIFTVSISLAGLPGLTVPGGFSKEGLPIGLQLVGKACDEPTLLKTGFAYEKETEYFKKRPPL